LQSFEKEAGKRQVRRKRDLERERRKAQESKGIGRFRFVGD
jgi:hypothetical protein